MNDCRNHKKDLFGETDMKALGRAIGDLHYESLKKLLQHLSDKLYSDAAKDAMNGRQFLANELGEAATKINLAWKHIAKVWRICKPFMKEPPNH